MTIHVINLDRDAERLEKFLRLNAHVGEIHRAVAIEGARLDRAALEREGFSERHLRYSDGSLGNAHSHMTLWRQAVERGSVTTIAEDDAVFAKHFSEASASFLAGLPEDWDVVLWGWNFDAFLWAEIPEGVSRCKLEFNQDDLRRNLEAFRNGRHAHVPVRLRHAFGTLAYSISPRGARAMLDACLPLKNRRVEFSGFDVVIENRSFDSMMNAVYPQLKAYVCMPPLAVSENRHETSNTRAWEKVAQFDPGDPDTLPRPVAPALPPVPHPASTVMLAILARNKGHVLADFLRCIEALDYPKASIDLYVRTNDNGDDTEAILRAWLAEHGAAYRSVDFDHRRPPSADAIALEHDDNPHAWATGRLRVLAQIREASLRAAQTLGCDYYFVVDCDNFITPWTLRALIDARKPIVAPMLETAPRLMRYSNYFCGVDANGYYAEHPEYDDIRWRRRSGLFQVPLVHCTYLIEAAALPGLAYHDDGPQSMEFVTFARVARAQGIGQWIDNRHGYGELLYFEGEAESTTLEQEVAIWRGIREKVMRRVLAADSPAPAAPSG